MGYRILYHHRTQALDGQRVHINAIQRALREQGHDVVEIAPLPAVEAAGGTPVRTWRRQVLEHVASAAPRGAYELLELSYNLVGYRSLAAAIRAVRPHFIYERYALNTVAGAWASARFQIPLLLEVNSPLADEKHALGQLLFYRNARRLERHVLRRATRVLAVTEVLAGMLRKAASLPDGRVIVVQNGADPEEMSGPVDTVSVRAERGWAPADFVLGSVGFFREWHGIDSLLRALAVIHTSRRKRVLLVGDGPARSSLERLAGQLGLATDVVFTGSVSHETIPRYLAAMDAVVIPRAVEYASPLKLFEYMAAGKAILAPRQPNLLEVITENVDALCFEPENLTELGSALGRMICDESLCHRLGLEAQRTIARNDLTWSGNARRIVEVFEGVSRTG